MIFLKIFFAFISFAHATELRIAAASDLQPAIQKLIASFQEKHLGIKFSETYGSSGNFVTQIENGANFDLFFSADQNYAQILFDHKKAIQPPQRFARGSLAICLKSKPKSDTSDLKTLTQFKKISIANPKHAPYGRAAVEAISKAGLYEELQKKLILGENASQSALFLESGAADAGLIAFSLTLLEPMKKFFCQRVDSQLYQPLTQAFVILTHTPEAQSFAEFLKTSSAEKIFIDSGFLPVAQIK